MKRSLTALLAVLFVLVPASGAFANHLPPTPPPTPGVALAVPAKTLGNVRAIANAPAAQAPAAPFGETRPFTRDGKTYIITSSMWYGLQVVEVTDPLKPSVVSNYAASTTCASYPEAIAAGDSPGDVLAAQGGWENDLAYTADGRFAILGADAGGRCHDPASGGIEIIDVTDVTNPRTLHLTRNVGEAHSVTVDPVHEGLAYLSTSDGADLMDIVDFRSCLGGVANLAACKVTVSRVVFDKAFYPQLRNPTEPDGPDIATQGCHDLRFRGERAYCAAIGVSLIFDTSKLLGPDGKLTGTHLTAGPDACAVHDAWLDRAPGVKVTDCLNWTESEFATKSATPATMPLVSFVRHGNPELPPFDIAHQAEAIADGRIMFVTDEAGGGLNVGANACPGGGVWFYDIRDETKPTLMKQADGEPAVFITRQTNPSPASCTAHYGSEFADENLLVFGWYTGGIHVIRYDVDFTTTPATITFTEVAAFVPLGGEVIQAMGLQRNPTNPGELIVYGADWFRGIDVIGATVERITRAAAFKTGGSQVKGTRQDKGPLPKTGVGDPTSIALSLLVLALAVGRRLRVAWR